MISDKIAVFRSLYSKIVKSSGAVTLSLQDEDVTAVTLYHLLFRLSSSVYKKEEHTFVSYNEQQFEPKSLNVFILENLTEELIFFLKKNIKYYSSLKLPKLHKDKYKELKNHRNDFVVLCDFGKQHLTLQVLASPSKLLLFQNALFQEDSDLKFALPILQKAINRASGRSLDELIKNAETLWNDLAKKIT